MFDFAFKLFEAWELAQYITTNFFFFLFYAWWSKSMTTSNCFMFDFLWFSIALTTMQQLREKNVVIANVPQKNKK